MKQTTVQKIVNKLSLELVKAGDKKSVYRRYTTLAVLNNFNPMTFQNFERYYDGNVKTPSLSITIDLCRTLDISVLDIIPDEEVVQ